MTWIEVPKEVLEKIVLEFLQSRPNCWNTEEEIFRECIREFVVTENLCEFCLFDCYSYYTSRFPDPYNAWRNDLEGMIDSMLVRFAKEMKIVTRRELKYYFGGVQYKYSTSNSTRCPNRCWVGELTVSEDEVDKQLLSECILAMLKHERTGVDVSEYNDHSEVIDKRFCSKCIRAYIMKRGLCCACLFDKAGYFELRNKLKSEIPTSLKDSTRVVATKDSSGRIRYSIPRKKKKEAFREGLDKFLVYSCMPKKKNGVDKGVSFDDSSTKNSKHKVDKVFATRLFFRILERTRAKSEEYGIYRWQLIGECVDLYAKSKGLGMSVGTKYHPDGDMSTKIKRYYLMDEFRYILNELFRKHRDIIKMHISEGRRYYSMSGDIHLVSEFL